MYSWSEVGRQRESVSLPEDFLEHGKMEGDLETERDWAYLCQAFTVAKDPTLEAEKEYTNLATAPLLPYGDTGSRVEEDVEILEERGREDFASIDYVRTGVVMEEVKQGEPMELFGAGVSENEDRVRAALGVPSMVSWQADASPLKYLVIVTMLGNVFFLYPKDST